MMLAMGSVVIGHTVWANINAQTDFGTALTASFFAIVTLLLAITSYQQANSVDRASGYRRAVRNLDDLDAWHLELTRRGLPLGAAQSSLDTRDTTFPWATLRAYGIRVMLIGVVATLYLCVLMSIGVAVRLSGHVPAFSWWMVKLLFIYWLYGMTVVLVVGVASFLRWTAPPPARARWLLEITAHVVRWGYFILATLLTAADWIANGVDAGLFSYHIFLLTPAIAWWVLWSSRRWPNARIPGFLGGHFWGLVDWSIQNNRRIHRHRRDNLLRDELDEISYRPEAGRYDTATVLRVRRAFD